MLIFAPDIAPPEYLAVTETDAHDLADFVVSGVPDCIAPHGSSLYIQELEPSGEPGFLWVRVDRRGDPVALFYAVGPSKGPIYVQETVPGAEATLPWLWVKVDANGDLLDLVVNDG